MAEIPIKATARMAAAIQMRPRPPKPRRTNPSPGTRASNQASRAGARSGSRARREANASTVITQPIRAAYHPVEIRSTGVKVNLSVLRPGVVTIHAAHPTHATSAAPVTASAMPWYGRAECITDNSRPTKTTHASGLVQPNARGKWPKAISIVQGVRTASTARPTIMMSRLERPESRSAIPPTCCRPDATAKTSARPAQKTAMMSSTSEFGLLRVRKKASAKGAATSSMPMTRLRTEFEPSCIRLHEFTFPIKSRGVPRSVVALSRFLKALGGRNRERLREPGDDPGGAHGRHSHLARRPIPGRHPLGTRVSGVPDSRIGGGRLRGPLATPTHHDRLRRWARAGVGIDSRGVRIGPADARAALCGGLAHGDLHGFLRRLISVLPARARRPPEPDRRQHQAGDHALDGAGGGAGHRRFAHSVDRGREGGRRRRAIVSPFCAGACLHQKAGA